MSQGTFQNFGKSALRTAKNYTKGYSDTQAKVRDATSNDPWGPSGTQMNEIAQMTYNQNDFVEIMEMLDKRLNDKGKNWRHVFKSLTVLDYCLHAGSENVVIYFKDNLYIIKTLREFQYVDEYGKDQGANVRQKAKDIANLLLDENRLREERQSRANMRDRMVRGGNNYDDERENENRSRRDMSAPPSSRRRPREDDDLQKALDESKRLAEREGRVTAEDRDLEEAIRLSKEEEDKRNKAVADSNASSLFDEQAQQQPQNNGQLIDTSFNQFGNLQPQYTAMPMQPQFTSFNPYQQQAQQEAMQAEYLRQQQEWMLQQQQEQQAAAAQAQLQAQQEEWMRQQQMLQFQQQQQQQQFLAQQQQPIGPQPTGFGSNNPFALNSGPPAASPLQQSSSVSFNLGGTFQNAPAPQAFSPPPQPASAPPSSIPAQSPIQKGPTRADQQNPQLASFLANRDDGMDTFGNTGLLRYGQTGARVAGQPTGAPGHNPFAAQQQQQSSDQPFFSI